MPHPAKMLWPKPAHTEAKHRMLRRYLRAWFPILLQGPFPGLTYFEGFAGPRPDAQPAAFGCQAMGRGAAEAGRSATDQRHPAPDPEIHRALRSCPWARKYGHISRAWPGRVAYTYSSGPGAQ